MPNRRFRRGVRALALLVAGSVALAMLLTGAPAHAATPTTPASMKTTWNLRRTSHRVSISRAG